MRLNKILLSLAIALNFSSLPVVAQTAQRAVRTIPAVQAQSQKPVLTLWTEGGGLNLNFIPTGEVIKKVWLDDPSRISLSSDGHLCSGAESDCSNSGATVLHLKRIEPIDFPNLPATQTTLLSVVTESSQGRQLYQFEVQYGSGEAQYSTATIEPDTVSQGEIASLIETAEIERGLQVAQTEGLISPARGNQVLVERVEQFLALTRSGISVQLASEQAQVSMVDLNQLAQLGQQASIQPTSN